MSRANIKKKMSRTEMKILGWEVMVDKTVKLNLAIIGAIPHL